VAGAEVIVASAGSLEHDHFKMEHTRS